MSFMKKHILTTFFLAFTVLSLQAQTINWATDIAPILYNHCVQCHRDGGIGGFSLVGYNNAYSNRYGILDATENKRMPPWKANPEYRHFRGENVLNPSQLSAIEQWVNANAPAGDLGQAPPDPVFTIGSEIGQPDEVLQTPLYTMTSQYDEYRCFVIPSGLQADAFLRGLEVIPGNHEAVHHVLVFEDTTGQAKILDQQTPEPGYVSFGGINVQDARLVGAWVPGSRPELFPEFMGVKLHKNSDLVLQVHFPAAAVGMSESSTVNLFFTPTTQGVREVAISPVLNHGPLSLEGFPLNIPANAVKTYHAKYTVPANVSLISIAPHMHLIGTSMICYGVTLQGDTIPLIDIPEWDFHWQGAYTFQKVEKIPFGTKLHAYAVYDNTLNNPNNPNNPPQTVTAGEATTDEMMLVYFTYMLYQAGDENIVLDSTLLSSAVHQPDQASVFQDLQVSPNPAQTEVTLQYTLLENTDVLAEILNTDGRSVKIFALKPNLSAGTYTEKVLVADLPPGMYFIRLQAANGAAQVSRLIKS
ncbi:MAG: T9SS type A sorting domain-containing protein [Lewinellaceae bacterium]|nr:T9SS type A sorting domain-containing protein [Lewinellaceae bacterium]